MLRGVIHRQVLVAAILLGLAHERCLAATPALSAARPDTSSAPVLVGDLNAAIGPATVVYVERLIQLSAAQRATCLVLRMDTPGGLSESMRDIIQAILASDVPVVTYVSPGGARAASAGALIVLASHVAAMAPSTNIGAAHPVSIGPGGAGAAGADTTMEKKITNDAAALARSIATQRGRNVEWAERAVRNSISSTAAEALDENVIDLVSPSLPDLLQSLDGRSVEVPAGRVTLHTAQAAVEETPPSFRERFLGRISDPNIAYVLMLVGVFGILFELQNPGAVLPGVVGSVALVTAAFAFQMLPVNWTGLALIVIAMVLFILDIKVTSHGVLTLGGIVAMLIGSIMLIDSPMPFMRISLTVIIPSVIFTALFFLFAVGMGLRAQRRRVTTGTQGLVGEVGVARTIVYADGSVFVHGEYWNAFSDKPVPAGTRVVVKEVDGMRVRVEPKP